MILTNTAELHLVNLVLINLCDNLLTLNQQGTVSWYTASECSQCAWSTTEARTRRTLAGNS